MNERSWTEVIPHVLFRVANLNEDLCAYVVSGNVIGGQGNEQQFLFSAGMKSYPSTFQSEFSSTLEMAKEKVEDWLWTLEHPEFDPVKYEESWGPLPIVGPGEDYHLKVPYFPPVRQKKNSETDS
jgi:hypothetical protein